jgi:hypothetical protein
MAGVDLCLRFPVGQCPGRGHRLRWREGQVEPGYGRAEGPSLGPFLGLDAGPLLGPFGVGAGRRDGSSPLRHPACQGEVRTVGLATERLPSDRVGAHPQQVEQVLFGNLGTLLDPVAVIEASQAGAQEHAGRGPRRGVVAGQVGGVTRGPVTHRDRLHQVAIARPQGHPAQRDHGLLPSPGRPSSRTSEISGRPPSAPSGKPDPLECHTCEAN